MTTIAPLPSFPSSLTRANLPPSQLADLYVRISGALQNTLSLSPQKRDTEQMVTFITSYTRDAAQEALTALIWSSTSRSKKIESREAKSVRTRVLQLVEQLAPTGALPLNVLLDIAVAYAAYPTRVRVLFAEAFSASPIFLTELSTSAIPAFREVLTSNSTTGLYSLRKVAQCLVCFLRAVPQDMRLATSCDVPFVLALAHAYDTGLATIMQSYGGLRLSGRGGRELDEWERLVLETKVALLDTFHVLMKAVFGTLAQAESSTRSPEAHRALELLLALQSSPAHISASPTSAPPTPFLNRTLLADYHHAHDLSHFVERIRVRAERDDAWDTLAASLRALDEISSGSGALTLLFGSGVPPSVDSRSIRRARSLHLSSTSPPASMSAIADAVDAQINEVLGILPDYPREYIRRLLARPEFGTVERVVEALLDGTAPPAEQIAAPYDEFHLTHNRANVFDAEEMDLSRVHIGKKSGDAKTLLNDRSFMESAKPDILRRIEDAHEGDDEDDGDEAAALAEVFGRPASGDRGRVQEVAFEEELDALDVVRVAGDGEATDEGSDEGEVDAKVDPQTILELAYIADPKVFERDAVTRRSVQRATLRTQTGKSLRCAMRFMVLTKLFRLDR